MPTERPPLVGEVSVNFCGQRVLRGHRNESPRPYSQFSRPENYINNEIKEQIIFGNYLLPFSSESFVSYINELCPMFYMGMQHGVSI
jgi:hypothetical protein